jgi:starch synthase
MKILMATSEFSPLASTGDLGDQVGILATELKRLGHDVSVVMPLYRAIRESKQDIRPTGTEFQVNLGSKRATTDILETTGPDGIQVLMIRRDEYFDRSGIYGGDGRPYDDNAERFIFFSKVVVELAQRLTPSPEIIHCHDWTAALVPVFVRDRQSPFRTALTIHNLEYQGSFWSFDFALTNLPGSYFAPNGVEFYGRLNFLKAGILYADVVTLPGETALFEAFTLQHSFGLDAVLRENHFKTFGIPHGVDYSVTNPPFEALYGKNRKSDSGKSGCRQAILEQFSLDKDLPGVVYALPIERRDEAAFSAVKEFLDLILTGNACLIVSGKIPEADLAEVIVAERKYPTRFRHLVETDPKTGQLILAGSDAVLLPSSLGSRAITLLTAMRYATLPVVKYRGGIYQIICDCDPMTDSGNGFIYCDQSPGALPDSVRRVNELYQQGDLWAKLAARAQRLDMSWHESATAFTKLYANLLRHRTPGST